MSGRRTLEGRLANVTGASRVIGCAIAERIATAGAEVVVAARTMKELGAGSVEATVERICERGGKAHPMFLDVEDCASREALINDIALRFGRIDILVNNAGTASYHPTDQMSIEAAQSQTNQYFLGPWHLCSLALPYMKKQNEARILNIGSCVVDAPSRPYAGYFAQRGCEALYAGLKTGIYRFSLGLAAELYGDRIAVNVLTPVGAVLTPGVLALGLGLTEDMDICELVEDMAEAAVEMLGWSVDMTGESEFSYRLLDRIGRSTLSTDGERVVVDRSAGAARNVG